MSAAANAALAEPWKDLWNGDLSITEKIIAADFAAHAAPLTARKGVTVRYGRYRQCQCADRRDEDRRGDREGLQGGERLSCVRPAGPR